MLTIGLFVFLKIIQIATLESICPFNSYTLITGFNDFTDLNFNGCPIVNLSILEVKPDIKLILDYSFKLDGIKINPIDNYFVFMLTNFKGIEFHTTKIFDSINFETNFEFIETLVELRLSNFDFYADNVLIDQDRCKQSLYYTQKGDIIQFWKDSFMTKTHYLHLHKTVKFPNPICPYVFGNAELSILDIDKLSNSFVDVNILSFIDIPDLNDTVHRINSQIFQFSIKVFHLNIDKKLLNKYVFKDLQAFDINGQINLLENDLFKSIETLKVLRFRTQNAKRILTYKNKWMDYLNYKINVNLNDPRDLKENFENLFVLSIFQTFSNITYYNFPEEDFCYFKDFPHHRLVMPHLKPHYKSICSCTELFLIQYSYGRDFDIFFYEDRLVSDYYFLSQYYIDDITEADFSNCINNSNRQSLVICNFKARLNSCIVKGLNATIDDKLDWYMTDWYKLSNISYFSFSVCINPILSIFSISINILMILILSTKKIKKDFKRYVYLKINSFSNLIYIQISLFDLMTNCVLMEFFCSSLSDSIYVKYFNLIFLKSFKNFLKTFSNVSYFAFILLRYVCITSSKNSFLKKFEKISLRKFLSVSIAFSILINFYIYFEYAISKRIGSESRWGNQTLVKAQDPIDNFKADLTTLESTILHSFQYIKIIFSDFLFFILSITIDVALLISIRKSIQNSQNLSTHNIKMKKSSKAKITEMILLNGINFFILRFPSNVADLYGLIFTFIDTGTITNYKPNLSSYIICRVFRFCENLQEIFYFCYLVSILLQFFIFYRTDRNFKDGFNGLKIKFKLSEIKK